MTPEGVDHLRAHARSIVRSAGLSQAIEADIEEEIVGHLIERAESEIGHGLAEDEGIRRAIAAFGDAASVGTELGRTFHSRAWASTIGVLVAARAAPAQRPGVIGALRLLVAINVIFAAVAAVVAIAELTPLYAALDSVACVGFVVAGALAYRGLDAGLRWSLGFAIGAASVLVLEGVAPTVPTPPGTTTIPILAIFAAVTLVGVGLSIPELRSFVADSTSIGRPLAVALAILVLLPTLAVRGMPVIPDPTQATAADASLALAMDCGRRFDAPSGREVQFASVVADVAFRRTDLLPLGLIRQLDRGDAADAAGFRIVDPEPIPIENGGELPRWLLADDGVDVRVVETNEVAGWFGASSDAANMLPDTIGSFTVGIDPDRISPNRTIRIRWTIIPVQEGDQPWPQADVAFAHLTRFLIEGPITCGGRTTGAPVPGAMPHPVDGGFLPG